MNYFKYYSLLLIICVFVITKAYAAELEVAAGETKTLDADVSSKTDMEPAATMGAGSTLIIPTGFKVEHTDNNTATNSGITDVAGNDKVTIENAGIIKSVEPNSFALDIKKGNSLVLTNTGIIGDDTTVNVAINLDDGLGFPNHSITNSGTISGEVNIANTGNLSITNTAGAISKNITANGTGAITINSSGGKLQDIVLAGASPLSITNTGATIGNVTANSTGLVTVTNSSGTIGNLAAGGGTSSIVLANSGTVGTVATVAGTASSITVNSGSVTGNITLKGNDTFTYNGATTLNAVDLGQAGDNTVNINTNLVLTAAFDAKSAVAGTVNLIYDSANPAISGAAALDLTNDTVNVALPYPQKITGDFKVVDVTGGGLTKAGTNVTLPASSALLNFTGSVLNANDITLNATATSLDSLIVEANDDAVSAAIISAIPTAVGDFGSSIGEIYRLPTKSAVQTSVSSLKPLEDLVTPTALTQLGQNVASAVASHVDMVRVGMGDMQTGYVAGDMEANGKAKWYKFFGNSTRQRQRGDYAGYKAHTYGFALGVDKLIFNDDARIGLGFSYGNTGVKPQDILPNRTDADSYQGILYASMGVGNFLGDGSFIAGYNKLRTKRNITIGPLNRIAKGDFSGYQLGLQMRVGCKYEQNFNQGAEFIPTAIFQFSRVKHNKYTEIGADSLSLRDVSSEAMTEVKIGPGVRVGHVPQPLSNYRLYPEAHAYYLINLTKNTGITNSTFVGGGSSFETKGLAPVRSSFNLGASLHVAINEALYAIFEYDAHLMRKYVSHSGAFSLKYFLVS